MHTENLQAQLDQALDLQRWLLTIAQRIAGSEGLDAIPPLLTGTANALGANSVRLLIEVGGTWRAYSSVDQGDYPELDGVLVDALDQQMSDGVVEFVRGQHIDLMDTVPESVGSVYALRLRRPDGRWQGLLWAACSDARSLDKNERGFIQVVGAAAEMMINRARTAAEARAQGELLDATMTGTPDPVLIIDGEVALRVANPAARDAFEALGESRPGQPLSSLEGLTELVPLLDDGLDLAHPGQRPEFAAGNGKTYLPHITPIQGEDGSKTGWVIVLRDISPLKRLNDNMSEFVSRVSHDLRSPLTFMKGYLDMMGMVGPLNEKQTGFVEKTTSGVMQMSDMVEKVLEAAKIDPVTGRYTLSREQCDMVELVEKIMAALAEPATRNHLHLTHVIDPGAPVMNLDRGMISSAYTNLVENAIKYTPQGGMIEVALEVDRDRNELIFQVKDNGLGISEADQRNLFQRHQRVHRQEWARIKGSGLGLFIVKNVAQRHGGDAWVVSAPGQGSTFFLSLPMVGANMIAGEAAARD